MIIGAPPPEVRAFNDKLVSFLRAEARLWKNNPSMRNEDIMRFMASELMVTAAALARDFAPSPDFYMEGARRAVLRSARLNYSGRDIVDDMSGLAS